MDQESMLTITQAAERAGVHRRTIRRALDRDAFPGAEKDDADARTPWLIPIGDLDAAGYGVSDDTTGDTEPADDTPQVAPDSAMVPLDTFRDLFQRLADVQERAIRAETERDHLRQRLEEARAAAAADKDEDQENEPAASTAGRWLWSAAAVLIVAVATALILTL